GAVIAAKASHGATEDLRLHFVAFGVVRSIEAAERVVSPCVTAAVLGSELVACDARADSEATHVPDGAADTGGLSQRARVWAAVGQARGRRPVLGIAALPEAEVADVLGGVAKGLQHAELAKRTLGVGDASAT